MVFFMKKHIKILKCYNNNILIKLNNIINTINNLIYSMFIIYDQNSNVKNGEFSYIEYLEKENKRKEISLLIDSLLDYEYLNSRFKKEKKNKMNIDSILI